MSVYLSANEKIKNVLVQTNFFILHFFSRSLKARPRFEKIQTCLVKLAASFGEILFSQQNINFMKQSVGKFYGKLAV